MSSEWEEKFTVWAKPPSETEKERLENAERAIREAVDNDEELSNIDYSIDVFDHGSYKNRTNVRKDSDVDICVCPRNLFFSDLPSEHPLSTTLEHFGIGPGKISHSEFKNLLENALVQKFGQKAVLRGNKAFTVRENTYRVNADVLAAIEYRRYTGNHYSDGTHEYLKGIAFIPHNEERRIINWPQQTYDSGIEKNKATIQRYKSVIRILKRLRNEMQEENIEEADEIHSFLIESMVWNVPNAGFGHDTLTADVRYAIAHTFDNTREFETCKDWREVNKLKFLFRDSQPWTKEQANTFLDVAWGYIGFD